MKLAGNYPASPAMKATCSDDCQIYIYEVPGGYVFETVGRAADLGVFGQVDGTPFPTLEAAKAVGDDPESGDAGFWIPPEDIGATVN